MILYLFDINCYCEYNKAIKRGVSIMKPSEMGLNEKLFGSEFKNVTLPNDTSYNFLYERNKNYMENVAIRFENQEITYADFHTIVDEYARSFY